jgi:hypothetical protein
MRTVLNEENIPLKGYLGILRTIKRVLCLIIVTRYCAISVFTIAAVYLACCGLLQKGKTSRLIVFMERITI